MGLAAGTAIAWVAPAQAQQRVYEIPAGDLQRALSLFARQSGRQIIYKADDVRGVRSPGVHSQASAEAALARILAGTGFTSRVDSSGAIAIVSGATETGAEPLPPENQDIVVTANKREERLQNVPASVTAETGRGLAHRGATQLEDVIRTTPGLSNPGSGSGNKTNLTIRGVTTGNDPGLKQSTVSLMFDDIPLDPASSSLGATNLRLVDVERVEVLRGPQGTLFGSGSLSGALRIISNKPDMTRLGGSAEITGAATNGGDGSVWGDAVLNIPLVEDQLAVRAVGYGFQEGGWVDNSRTGQKDVNGNETYGGRIALAARMGERLSMNVTAAYQNSHDYGGGESLYTPVAGADDPYAVTTNRKSQESRVESSVVNLGLRYDLDAVSLISSTSYIRRKASLADDVGYYNELVGAQLHIPGLTGPAPAITLNNADIFTQELRLTSTGTGPLRWTLGGFYLKATADGGQWVTSAVLAPLLGSGNLATLESTGRQEELSGFGELTYTIAGHLDLTAGLRISDTLLDFQALSSGVLLSGSPSVRVATNTRERDTAYNPRFAIAWRPSGVLTLYVEAARGYRVGGPNQTAGLGGPDIPRAYGSDSLWNYEAGAKGRAFDGALSYSAAAYYIDWSNMQTSLRLNNVGYVGNAGSAHIYGLELELAAHPVAWLDLGGAFAASHGETATAVPNLVRVTGVVGLQKGMRLPGSPELQASGFAQINFEVAGHKAYLRGAAQYIGDEYTDYAESGTRFGDYATADLRAGLVLDHFELVGFVNNLFDSHGKRGAIDLATAGPILAQPQVAYRVRPRTIGATLRTSF